MISVSGFHPLIWFEFQLELGLNCSRTSCVHFDKRTKREEIKYTRTAKYCEIRKKIRGKFQL